MRQDCECRRVGPRSCHGRVCGIRVDSRKAGHQGSKADGCPVLLLHITNFVFCGRCVERVEYRCLQRQHGDGSSDLQVRVQRNRNDDPEALRLGQLFPRASHSPVFHRDSARKGWPDVIRLLHSRAPARAGCDGGQGVGKVVDGGCLRDRGPASPVRDRRRQADRRKDGARSVFLLRLLLTIDVGEPMAGEHRTRG